jgi:hypothetical protein
MIACNCGSASTLAWVPRPGLGFQGLAWVHEGLRRPRRRSYGIAGSGGVQRCDLLPLEAENAAATTPERPGCCFRNP